jgi:hypothetical protein
MYSKQPERDRDRAGTRRDVRLLWTSFSYDSDDCKIEQDLADMTATPAQSFPVEFKPGDRVHNTRNLLATVTRLELPYIWVLYDGHHEEVPRLHDRIAHIDRSPITPDEGRAILRYKIDALTAENARLQDELQRTQGALARAVEALYPFKKAAGIIAWTQRAMGRSLRNEETLQSGLAWREKDGSVGTITYGDLRRAASALAAGTGKARMPSPERQNSECILSLCAPYPDLL